MFGQQTVTNALTLKQVEHKILEDNTDEYAVGLITESYKLRNEYLEFRNQINSADKKVSADDRKAAEKQLLSMRDEFNVVRKKADAYLMQLYPNLAQNSRAKQRSKGRFSKGATPFKNRKN